MALVTFKTREKNSQALVGVLHEEQVRPLASERLSYSIKAVLARQVDHSEAPMKLADHSFTLDEIEFLPVIPSPGKIICVGLNYHAHRIETGNIEQAFPTLFCRYASCLVGHQQDVWRPSVSQQMDFEGELAVVIGRRAYQVSEAQAMRYVAGYSCFNDISIRDWQRHTSQFTPGKNFMRTGAFGPALITTDEVPDPTTLSLTTRLNGEVVQNTTTDLMIFSIPQLIAYITSFTELLPGDVISTGTPGGVGVKRNPKLFMQPGDEIEVDISGVGLLSNTVVAQPDRLSTDS